MAAVRTDAEDLPNLGMIRRATRNVRGMVILPSLGKDFFTSDSKEFFA